jgi:hypothetical protein
MQQVNQHQQSYLTHTDGYHEYSYDLVHPESLKYTLSYLFNPDYSKCTVTLYQYETSKISIYSQDAEDRKSFKDIYPEILNYLYQHYKALTLIHDAMLKKFSSNKISQNLIAHTDHSDDQAVSKYYYSVNDSQEIPSSPFLKMFYQKTPFFLRIEVIAKERTETYLLQNLNEFTTMQLIASDASEEPENILSLAFDDIYDLISQPPKDSSDTKKDQCVDLTSLEKKLPTNPSENSTNNAGSQRSSSSAPEIHVSELGTPASSRSQTPMMSQNFNSIGSSKDNETVLENYNKTLEVISKLTQSIKPKTFENTHWQTVYKKMGKLLTCGETIKNSIADSKDEPFQKVKQLNHLRDFLVFELYTLSQEISFGWRNGSRLYNFLLESILTIKDIATGLSYASFFEKKEENTKPFLRNLEKIMPEFKLNPIDFYNFHTQDIEKYRGETAILEKEARNLEENIITQTYLKI